MIGKLMTLFSFLSGWCNFFRTNLILFKLKLIVLLNNLWLASSLYIDCDI